VHSKSHLDDPPRNTYAKAKTRTVKADPSVGNHG